MSVVDNHSNLLLFQELGFLGLKDFFISLSFIFLTNSCWVQQISSLHFLFNLLSICPHISFTVFPLTLILFSGLLLFQARAIFKRDFLLKQVNL